MLICDVSNRNRFSSIKFIRSNVKGYEDYKFLFVNGLMSVSLYSRVVLSWIFFCR